MAAPIAEIKAQTTFTILLNFSLVMKLGLVNNLFNLR